MWVDNYVENDVNARDPIELICLLYLKAIEKLRQALGHLERGEIRERAAAVAHVHEIILELQGSLDLDQGGEIAKNLARLYDYLHERLAEANARQTGAPLEEAIRLLTTLHEGWHEIRATESLAEFAPTPAEAAVGQAWTL